MGALPAFAPDCLHLTARRFVDVILLPMVMRALFGEDLATLRAEIGSHASQAVAFFLAACRHAAPPLSHVDQPATGRIPLAS